MHVPLQARLPQVARGRHDFHGVKDDGVGHGRVEPFPPGRRGAAAREMQRYATSLAVAFLNPSSALLCLSSVTTKNINFS